MIRALPPDQQPTIEVFVETDPVENENARMQRAQFDQNSDWLQSHIQDVYVPENRGKVVAIAGQTAYFGDTVEEAVAKAVAAHPQDKGYFTRYIPKHKLPRIYAS